MYFDGSYTLKGAGAGIVFIPPESDIIKYAIQLEFPATNNIAEYEGLVTSLRLAKDLGIQRLLIKGDSQLVFKPTPSDVIIEKLFKPSVKPAETANEAIKQDLMVIDEPDQEPEYDWMNPVKMFLENQPPSDDNAKVEHITRRSKQYILLRGYLVALRHSQRYMWITFIMAFNQR
jgi:ribonuclease HI